jgi:hypothetical protein
MFHDARRSLAGPKLFHIMHDHDSTALLHFDRNWASISWEHSLDRIAADVEPLEGLLRLDLLEHADPLLCNSLQVGIVARNDEHRGRGLALALSLRLLPGGGSLTHRGGAEMAGEEAGGAEEGRGKRAGRILPDEREASPEAHKHKAAEAETMRRMPEKAVGRRMR